MRLVLESFKEKLTNERIRWFTDNQNVVRIVQYGSPKPLLQAETLKRVLLAAIFDWNLSGYPESRMSWQIFIVG